MSNTCVWCAFSSAFVWDFYYLPIHVKSPSDFFYYYTHIFTFVNTYLKILFYFCIFAIVADYFIISMFDFVFLSMALIPIFSRLCPCRNSTTAFSPWTRLLSTVCYIRVYIFSSAHPRSEKVFSWLSWRITSAPARRCGILRSNPRRCCISRSKMITRGCSRAFTVCLEQTAQTICTSPPSQTVGKSVARVHRVAQRYEACYHRYPAKGSRGEQGNVQLCQWLPDNCPIESICKRLRNLPYARSSYQKTAGWW